jgi:transaldolase
VVERGEDDPGVQSVRRIYNYYKTHGYDTVVMGASFRNAGEIEALWRLRPADDQPGAARGTRRDRRPAALPVTRDAASDDRTAGSRTRRRSAGVNDDAMATEKLAEGIRNFIADQVKLEQLVSQL